MDGFPQADLSGLIRWPAITELREGLDSAHSL